MSRKCRNLPHFEYLSKMKQGAHKGLNKDVAGYLILLILAESDGDFDPREGAVIVDFLKEHFPLGGNMEEAAEIISVLQPDDYEDTFMDLAADFYADSTEEERKKFLLFALNLVKADEELAKSEDKMISKLFVAWDI